ncbi:MAG: endonuclease/exonuclease/phosphatase family protein [Desulfovibrionales bacterium]
MQSVFNGFLVLSGFFVLFATFIPLVRTSDWRIRIFDFPRLHLISLTIVLLLCAILFHSGSPAWKYFLLITLSASLLLHAYRIFPYTKFSTVQVPQAESSPNHSIRLVVANVLMSNRKSDGLLNILTGAKWDLILLLETDSWWERALRDLSGEYPHRMRYPLKNTYGMILYSRHPLVASSIKFLADHEVPSFHTLIRLPSGREIELHCLHPKPPRPTKRQDATERNIELLRVAREVRDRNRPVIVAGDLNDVAWSHTTRRFQRVSGLLDPRVGRGLFNTYHAEHPLLRWPLDHVFHSRDFQLSSIALLPSFGSDHFPFALSLTLEEESGSKASPC